MKLLKDLLNEKKYQKVNVKIGSKQGSCFWYCGEGDLALSLPEINNANIIHKERSKNKLEQLKYRLEHLDKIYEAIIEETRQRMIKNPKKCKVKDFDKYVKKTLKTKELERASLPKKIESVCWDIETDFLDRPVQEVVKGISPDEAPCYIIYVKGNEKGNYWTIKEYKDKNGQPEEEGEDEDDITL